MTRFARASHFASPSGLAERHVAALDVVILCFCTRAYPLQARLSWREWLLVGHEGCED